VLTICVHYDNQSTIGWTQSNIYNGKSKYIHRKHNIIKHLLSNIIIFIDYVKLKENIMDSLTKGLSREFEYHLSREIGLKPLRDEIM
jgi:hypothetical protein